MVDGGLRAKFRQKLPGVHWQTFEPGGGGTGVPDCNGCFNGVDFWIECKRTTGWAVKFQPTQVSWIEDRWAHFGKVYIAVRRENEASGADQLYLYAGGDVRDLAQYGINNTISACMWCGGPRNWDYVHFLSIVTGIYKESCKKALSPLVRSAVGA